MKENELKEENVKTTERIPKDRTDIPEMEKWSLKKLKALYTTYHEARSMWYRPNEIIWGSREDGESYIYVTQQAFELARKEITLRERSLAELAWTLSSCYGLSISSFCVLRMDAIGELVLEAVKLPISVEKNVENHREDRVVKDPRGVEKSVDEHHDVGNILF